MREGFLSNDQMLFLQKEKRSLQNVHAALSHFSLPAEDLSKLQNAIAQLDELFLIVTAGEFNAGKSALINALLGERVLEEGVTPTTAQVTLLRWGQENTRTIVDEGFAIVTYPLPLLKELNMVDSPGTNAINRQHERLTSDYVPRSDLVLFVTSAERPLTQSERVFLEKILTWGKKISLVVNKTDILEGDEAVEQVREFVSTNAEMILGYQPEIFMVSAKQAQLAQNTSDPTEAARLRQLSGIDNLEGYITQTLDDKKRLELKLRNPIGVASNLERTASQAIELQITDMQQDSALTADLETTISQYEQGLLAEIPPRLAEVENILINFENRGLDFFDRTMKLTNIFNLAKTDKIKEQFQEEVQGDVSQAIDNKVRGMIDWMVDKDLNTWYQVAGAMERRQVQSQHDLPGRQSPQSARRQELIENVSRTIKLIVNRYDRKQEAEQLADYVQESVAQTALFGIGALGVGAMVATVLTTKALDVTGIVTAGTLAVLGLFVIPYKRKQAKEDFKAKMAELRDTLNETLSNTFTKEADSAVERLRDNISPYFEYVKSEQNRLDTSRTTLQGLHEELSELDAEIDQVVR
ncbi:MAG: dynamin [Chloroflexi bacterium]|nr:dynamin [Chloroflexota bacterium]